MAFDIYGPCPCGSGKKFKWCCQPIHQTVEKAFHQDEQGQHDAAIAMMEQLTNEHPGNPEAWGRKAQLLYQNNRVEDAENAIDKALEINPKYAFGLLLRGMFRQYEGELPGGLLLFRKAAELYDPDARDMLAQVYLLIGDAELKLHKPVAARAAFTIAQRYRPNEELRRNLETLLGTQSRMPSAATSDYKFLSPSSSATPQRRALWDRAISDAASGRLAGSARAFAELAESNPDDAPAWYNLGLARAWLGENSGAVEGLDRYVSLEADEQKAAAAWALAEVLRYGQGMEEQADVVEHNAIFVVRDPRPFMAALQDWEKEGRLAGVHSSEEQQTLSGIVLDQAGLITAGAGRPAKLGAYFALAGNVFRLWNTNLEAVERTRRDMQQRMGTGLGDAASARSPAAFGDVFADGLLFPPSSASEEEARRIVREGVDRFLEETWIRKPLRSLGGVAPIDAAGHKVLRKKLLGLLQFLEQCAPEAQDSYDFKRLHRKLGLADGAPSAAVAEASKATADIEAMGAGELAALNPDALVDDELDRACRAAQKLDAHDLAARFAQALVGRPARPEHPDRFPLYSYLVQRAMSDGNSELALQYVDEGEKFDCEHNEGRRRNDFELRRGQVLSKRGEAESARDVFVRLIERVPSDLRFRGAAAEAMLTAKQGAFALQFADQGLKKAREMNDRDSEQYFLELAGAARKQGA
jgi:tetratricopeptide (TPR) repeat protein